MDSVPQKLVRLLPLLEMSYQAEQKKTAEILSRIRELRAQLNDLERPRLLPSGEIDAATMAGADILWESWVQDRKTLINRELAIASRDRELAKKGVIEALSKFEAAQKLLGQAKSISKKTRERRSNW